MEPTLSIAAAILTGGRGTRLDGARKGALSIGGRSIVHRQIEVLRPLALVVACDMPFLNRELIAAVAASDADLVIPRTARGYEPLCAVYSKRCGENIRARLERGERQASVMPEGLRVVEIGPEALAAYDPDDLEFVNVNTTHDYERANNLCERRLKASRDRIMDELGP